MLLLKEKHCNNLLIIIYIEQNVWIVLILFCFIVSFIYSNDLYLYLTFKEVFSVIIIVVILLILII